MIFECDASRLAICISWGHRDNNFFSKIHKKKDYLAPYRQKVSGIHFGRFLVLVFATRDLQNDMFCQLAETQRDFPVS